VPTQHVVKVVELLVRREVVNIDDEEAASLVIDDHVEAEQRKLQLVPKARAVRAHRFKDLLLRLGKVVAFHNRIGRDCVQSRLGMEIFCCRVLLLRVEVNTLSRARDEIRQRPPLRHVDEIAQYVSLEEAARVVDELLIASIAPVRLEVNGSDAYSRATLAWYNTGYSTNCRSSRLVMTLIMWDRSVAATTYQSQQLETIVFMGRKLLPHASTDLQMSGSLISPRSTAASKLLNCSTPSTRQNDGT